MAITRRKWFRRGQSLTDFLAAIFYVIGDLILHILGRGILRIGRALTPLFRSQPLQRTAQIESNGSANNGHENFKLGYERPKVTFDTIAGLEEVKEEIRSRTILPLSHPERASQYKLITGGALLMWGPPCCGKTLLGRAIAGELDAVFYHVKASTVIGKWVGEAEKNVAKLFEAARKHPRCVIFFDEIDALIPSRRRNRSTVMQRVVSEFLSQMDGVDSAIRRQPGKGFTLVLAATNWRESLDEAALRPGRFDVQVYVGLPDPAARRQIIEQELQGRTVSNAINIEELVVRTDGYSGADTVAVIEAAARHGFVNSVREWNDDFTLSKDDFDAAFERVRPSVSAAEIDRYENQLAT